MSSADCRQTRLYVPRIVMIEENCTAADEDGPATATLLAVMISTIFSHICVKAFDLVVRIPACLLQKGDKVKVYALFIASCAESNGFQAVGVVVGWVRTCIALSTFLLLTRSRARTRERESACTLSVSGLLLCRISAFFKSPVPLQVFQVLQEMSMSLGGTYWEGDHIKCMHSFTSIFLCRIQSTFM